jgi:hypothetical protein
MNVTTYMPWILENIKPWSRHIMFLLNCTLQACTSTYVCQGTSISSFVEYRHLL